MIFLGFLFLIVLREQQFNLTLAFFCLELGAGDLSERTQLEELEEDVHFVFR